MRLIEKKQKQKRYLMLIKKQIIEQQINKLHFLKLINVNHLPGKNNLKNEKKS